MFYFTYELKHVFINEVFIGQNFLYILLLCLFSFYIFWYNILFALYISLQIPCHCSNSDEYWSFNNNFWCNFICKYVPSLSIVIIAKSRSVCNKDIICVLFDKERNKTIPFLWYCVFWSWYVCQQWDIFTDFLLVHLFLAENMK